MGNRRSGGEPAREEEDERIGAAPLGTRRGLGDRKGAGKADAAEDEMGPREKAAMLWRRSVVLIATPRRGGKRARAGGGGDDIPFTVRAWVLWIVGSGGCGHDWIGWTDD